MSKPLPVSSPSNYASVKSPVPSSPGLMLGCLVALLFPLLFIAASLIVSGPQVILVSSRMLANPAIRRGDIAVQMLEIAELLWPNSARLHNSLGASYLRTGNLLEAIDQLYRAVSLDDQLAEAHNNLGAALLASRNPTSALPQLLAAVQLDPGAADAYLNLGRAYQSLGKLPEAQENYILATDLAPERPDAWVLLGQVALMLGNREQARSSFEQALQLDQGNAAALQGMGLLLLQSDRPAEALIYLNAASKLSPLEAPGHLYLGLALAAVGQTGQARNQLQQALSLTNDQALVQLAYNRLVLLGQTP